MGSASMSDAPLEPAGRFCHACGAPAAIDARFCARCGAGFASDRSLVATGPAGMPAPGREVFCRACGRAINAQALTCPGCGAPQRPLTAEGGKSRVAAALLALFLGGIGGHKFYLAKPFQGLIYLLLCWTFIPAIVGFIEGIAYLCMYDAGFARKYG